MKTLKIEDLSVTETLERHAMRAVRGGTGQILPVSNYLNFSPTMLSDNSKTVDPTQLISSTMNITSLNGYDTAFAEGVRTIITPYVNNSNNIVVR